MSLAKIREDLKEALKRKDQVKADALRLILAALQNAEKEKKGGELKEEEFHEVLSRLVKQRRESIDMYREGDREELAQKEEAELKVVQSYLPEQISEDEVKKLAQEAVEKVGASSPKEMGKVMAELMPKVKGLSLSEAEEKVCQVMQDAIPYWGRYPIPLEYNGVLPEVAVDDEFRRVFLNLHFRLGQYLYDLIRDGWDSGVGPRSIKLRSIKYGDEIRLDELPFE